MKKGSRMCLRYSWTLPYNSLKINHVFSIVLINHELYRFTIHRFSAETPIHWPGRPVRTNWNSPYIPDRKSLIWTHSDLIIDQINLRKIKVEVLHCFNETEQYLAMGDELLLTHLDTFGTHNIKNSDFFHLRCSLIDLSLQESEVTMTLLIST